MLRSRAALLLPIITAFAEGKEIEFRRPGSTPGQSSWEETNNPSWVEALEYRIKPEVPQYRLFQYKSGVLGVVLRHRTDNVLKYERYVQRNEGNWLTEWIPCPDIKLD